MTRAGFGKVEISARVVGAELAGYGNRERLALSLHDPLFARAFVLEAGAERVALCSVDLIFVSEDVVAAARERIARSVEIAPGNVFISATHTHSGPYDDDAHCWPEGLDVHIAAAVEHACEGMQQATIGCGWGMLHGHALNRRRFEDPVDPAVFVLRVDDLGGTPLGMYYGYGCHPVVLGPDSREASGDFAGICTQLLESHLDAVAVFGQGACADTNPMTPAVLAHLAQGRTVNSKLQWLSYYGPAPAPPGSNIGDREGGTFAEAEQLARVVADEVLRVHAGIAPAEAAGVWTRQLRVGRPAPPPPDAYDHPLTGFPNPRVSPQEPLEIMLVGIDGPGVMLVGEPGEVFSDTGIRLRRELRLAGVPNPFVVGYANGWRAYLPPADTIPDGGYEVIWAQMLGLPETLQDEIRAAVLDAARERLAGVSTAPSR